MIPPEGVDCAQPLGAQASCLQQAATAAQDFLSFLVANQQAICLRSMKL
jgi:hypothetical protein